MEQINVNVTAAGQSSEYYDLITVKQMLDELQAEIGQISESSVISVSAEVQFITAKPGNIYVWNNAPIFLNAEIESPEHTEKKSEYILIFQAGEGFRFTLSGGNTPIVLDPEASIMVGYNKVSISYVNGKYYVSITNYKE